MAEEATEPEVPVEEAVEEAATAEGAAEEDPATSSSVPKERVKRLPRPDDAELKAQTGSLNDKIQQAKARVEEIKELINSKSGNRGGSAEQQAVKGKLSDLRNQFQQELKEKQRIRQELDSHRAVREQLTKQQREMKSKCEYLTVDQVDEAIVRLENRMAHTSLSLNEEKKSMEDIKRLKASRSVVAQHAQRVQQLSAEATSNSKNDIMDRLKESDARLADIKAQEDRHREQLAAIRAKEDAQTADIPSLIKERNDQQALVKAAYSKILELREEHKAKYAAWKQVEDAWYGQRREDHLKRKEQQQKEWEGRQADRKAREAEMAGEPFDREVTMCEQLQAYLSKFRADAEASVTASPASSAPEAAPDGYKLAPKKKDAEDLGGFFAMGGKGGKKGRKKGGGEVRPLKPADQKLTHSLDMIAAFAALKMDTPITSSQVPGAVSLVAQRKAHYLDKRAKVKGGEEVQDADWERKAHANGPSTSGKGSQTTQNGNIGDMTAWPAIAGSHQIVDQEDAQPEGRGKQSGGDLAGALHDAELEDAGPVKQGLPEDEGAADAQEASENGVTPGLSTASSISVALKVGDQDAVAVAMTVDDQ